MSDRAAAAQMPETKRVVAVDQDAPMVTTVAHMKSPSAPSAVLWHAESCQASFQNPDQSLVCNCGQIAASTARWYTSCSRALSNNWDARPRNLRDGVVTGETRDERINLEVDAPRSVDEIESVQSDMQINRGVRPAIRPVAAWRSSCSIRAGNP